MAVTIEKQLASWLRYDAGVRLPCEPRFHLQTALSAKCLCHSPHYPTQYFHPPVATHQITLCSSQAAWQVAVAVKGDEVVHARMLSLNMAQAWRWDAKQQGKRLSCRVLMVITTKVGQYKLRTS